MSAHTPGPWAVFNEIDMRDDMPMLSIQANDSKESDTELSVCGIYNVTEKSRANARLIAAAPELLEALGKMDRILLEANPNLSPEYLFSKIQKAFTIGRAAIAKATNP